MFSGVVKLADVNDFINPNQSCVLPILQGKQSTKKINLADCLACNGCVTTAETILIQEHSIDKYFNLSEGKVKIILVSNQSIESFSSAFNIDNHKCIEIIAKVLKCNFIFTMSDINLIVNDLCYSEFDKRKKSIICSECPGWICYAEKKVGTIAFDYMSRNKSSQNILAIIIRELLVKYTNVKREEIYICSIMMCYDKKIESVRYKEEVNCVLSTLELEQMFEEELNTNTNIDTSNKISSTIYIYLSLLQFYEDLIKFKEIHQMKGSFISFIEDNIKKINNSNSNYTVIYHSKENFSSNSYAEYIIYKILSINKEYKIERKQGKNIDIKEINILDKDNNIKCKLCIAYGFRNIQNVVRNIKMNKLPYDYIELMACPGGCINGGGQIRKQNFQHRQLLKEIEENEHKNYIFFTEEEATIYKLMNLINKELPENIKSTLKQEFHSIDFSMSSLAW